MGRIQDKIILITGSAHGIGEACARLFIKEGAFVIISDIDAEKGKQLANELGSKSIYHHLDVKEESDWKVIGQFLKDKFGKIDGIVNNAGITGFVPFMGSQDPENATLESWRYVHSINLDGVFLGCKTAIALMKQHGGSIVNISSRSGLVGIPRAAAYAASKAAVRNHTKSVALYCAEEKYSIRCNSIHPGAILTRMWEPMLGETEEQRQKGIAAIAHDIPLKTMGEPNDVAYAALYLLSEEAKYVTGIELNVDGGILAGSAASPQK